jgi:hypothetical protein
MLALLCALARDPTLRDGAAAVLDATLGERVRWPAFAAVGYPPQKRPIMEQLRVLASGMAAQPSVECQLLRRLLLRTLTGAGDLCSFAPGRPEFSPRSGAIGAQSVSERALAEHRDERKEPVAASAMVAASEMRARASAERRISASFSAGQR